MSRITRIVVALLVVVASASCRTRGEAPPDPNDINVVVVLPFTEEFAAKSEIHKASVQMAFRDLEKDGALLVGRRIRAWLVDSTGDKAVAKTRVEDMVAHLSNSEGHFVAGMISSTGPGHEGSLPVALANGIPHFEVSSGSDDEEFVDAADYPPGALDYAFSSRALCREEAIMTADFLASRFQKIGLLRGDKAHDEMHTMVIEERLALLADGSNPQNPRAANPWTGAVVGSALEMAYPPASGSTDPWTSWQQHLENVANGFGPLNEVPNVIFFHLRGDTNNVDFLAAAKQAGFAPKIATCGMARKLSLLDAVTPGIVDYLAGNFWFVMRAPVPGDRLTAFKADLTQFANVDYDTFAPSAYDAAMLWGLAVARAGSTEPAAVRDSIGPVSREGTLVNYGNTSLALDLLRNGTDIDYDGASGPLTINTANHAVPGYYYVEEVTYSPGASEGAYVPLVDPPPQVLRPATSSAVPRHWLTPERRAKNAKAAGCH